MRRRSLGILGLVAVVACKSKGGGAVESGAKITATTEKYGVTLSATGPPGAVYTVGSDKLEWNGDTEAAAYVFGVATKDLPTGATISVNVSWFDHANAHHEQVISVPFTRPAQLSTPTTLEAKATPVAIGDGSGFLRHFEFAPGYSVALAPGCTVLLDGEQTYHFDVGAKWLRSSLRWEEPSGAMLPLRGDDAFVRAGRFPDVLHPEEKHVVRLECPGVAPQETSIGVDSFGRAWTVHDIFHNSVPSTHPAGARHTLVIVHGAKVIDGMRRGEDIARFYGPSVPVMDVDLVGKITEHDASEKPSCSGRTIELRSFEIRIDDRHGGLVDRTTIEPKLDCAKLDGPNVSSVPSDDGGTTLIVRPEDAQVDAFAKSVLR